MFDEFYTGVLPGGRDLTPALPTFAGFGYDKHNYISTANLAVFPYTTRAAVQAKIGGEIKLIEACDDSSPPIGDLTDAALVTYNSVILNVTNEINGYLSSVYPVPLAQTGTVAIIQVTTVDANGAITGIAVLESGGYSVAPNTTNAPAYLRHIDPMANVEWFGLGWDDCQTGTGASLTVAFTPTAILRGDGSSVNSYSVTGTPTIAAGGTGYQVNDILVLTGGSSFIPDKVLEAMLILCCHSFYQRRLAPDEKNPFADLAKFWRSELVAIGSGEKELDGMYKRFFSAGQCWGQRSVLSGANSL